MAGVEDITPPPSTFNYVISLLCNIPCCFCRRTPLFVGVVIISWSVVNTSDSDRVFCWSIYKKGSSQIIPSTRGTLVIMVWWMDGDSC